MPGTTIDIEDSEQEPLISGSNSAEPTFFKHITKVVDSAAVAFSIVEDGATLTAEGSQAFGVPLLAQGVKGVSFCLGTFLWNLATVMDSSTEAYKYNTDQTYKEWIDGDENRKRLFFAEHGFNLSVLAAATALSTYAWSVEVAGSGAVAGSTLTGTAAVAFPLLAPAAFAVSTCISMIAAAYEWDSLNKELKKTDLSDNTRTELEGKRAEAQQKCIYNALLCVGCVLAFVALFTCPPLLIASFSVFAVALVYKHREFLQEKGSEFLEFLQKKSGMKQTEESPTHSDESQPLLSNTNNP